MSGRLWSDPMAVPQRVLFFCGATLIAALVARWVHGTTVILWLSLAAMSIAMWHGAFDGVLAQEAFEPRWGRQWRPWFCALYPSLAALVLLLWWWAPAAALVAFLLYSALHFGTETERQFSPDRLLFGLSTGFVPIGAACHWWPQQVEAVFRLMLRGAAGAAVPIVAWSGRALWPALAIACIGAYALHGRRAVACWAMLAAELLLFRSCSPVVAFAVFFCLWHTPEHMIATSLDRSGRFQSRILQSHLRRGILPWLASLGGIAVACWWGRHQVESYLGVIFVALSALTVAHMALAELCRRARISCQQRRREVVTGPGLVLR